LLLTAGTWLLATPSGARLTLQRAALLAGAELQIAAVQGRLLGSLHLRGVAYRDSSIACTLGALDLEWQPRALLRRHLLLERLNIEEMQLRTLTSAAAPAPPPPRVTPEQRLETLRNLRLPVAITLRELTLRALSIATPEPLPAIDSLRISLHAAERRLTLKTLQLDSALGSLDLRLMADGWGLDSLAAEASWSLAATADRPRAAGRAQLTGRLPRLVLAHELQEPLRAHLGSEITGLPHPPQFTAHLRLEPTSTTALLPALEPSVQLWGEWQAAGTPDSLHLSGDLSLVPAALDTAQISLQLAFAPLRPDLTATPPLPAGRATLLWRHLAWPGVSVASPAGSLSVAGDPSAFTLTAALTTAIPDLPQLSWSLRARGDRDGLDLQHLGSALATNPTHAQLQLRGHLPFTRGAPVDLGWQLAADSLALLLPDLRGSLHGSGALRGDLLQPTLWFEIGGDSLALPSVAVGSWRLRGDLFQDRHFAADLLLHTLRSATGARVLFDSLSLHASGLPTDHRLTLDLAAPQASFAAELYGVAVADSGAASSAPSHWRGTLVRCEAAWRGAQAVLARDAQLRIDPGALSIEHFRWRSGPAELNLAANWRSPSSHPGPVAAPSPPLLDLTLSGVDPAMLDSLLEWPLQLGGSLSLCAHARDLSSRGAALEIALAGGHLRPLEGAPLFPLERLWLRAESTADEVHAALDCAAPGLATVTAAATLTPPPAAAASDPLTLWRRAHLSSELHLRTADLGVLAPLLPDVENLGGTLSADLDAGGPLLAPRLRGRVDLRDGRLDLPPLGAEYRRIALHLAVVADGSLALNGELYSAGSRLDLTGAASLWPAAAGSLQVNGEEFQLSSAPGLWLKVSPRLRATWRDHGLYLGGGLALPEGRLVMAAPPEPAVPISPDVVLLGVAPLEPTPPPIPFDLDLRLDLGPELYLEGFGLTAFPQGHLRLQAGDLAASPTVTGQLQLRDGRYQAFGQDLEIERGRIFFAGGPLEDPGLDLRARRLAEDGVIAGFEVVGSALLPRITLYSEPAMDDADALSYILLGHGRDTESSAAEEDQLGAALALVGSKGGGLLVRSMADRLGIEEARIATDGEIDETELILGTHITPRLWASYGLGLFNAASSLRARYRLNRHWALQGETGEANAADLLFTIER
jgi:translocation and assembly module TamB